MMFRTIVFGVFLTALVGCGSTPKRDDFAVYVNNLGAFTQQDRLSVSFVNPHFVDIRGIYDNDTSTNGTPILYDGSAGLIGVALQVGIHAGMTSSARSSQLAEQQKIANEKILPLTNKLGDMVVSDLVVENKSLVTSTENSNKNNIMLRPIFFANEEMNEISLKLVAWIPGKKAANPNYQNLVHIHSGAFHKDLSKPFSDMEPDEIRQHMSNLLDSGINVIHKDISGSYHSTNAKAETFVVNQNNKRKVIRGELIEKNVGYKVVKNLRNWYVLLPN